MPRMLEGTPTEVSLADVVGALEEMDGVADTHHVHAWALTSGRHVFSGHLRVTGETDAQQVLKRAYAMLKERFGFFFVTLQVEAVCLDESGAEAIEVTRRAGNEGRS